MAVHPCLQGYGLPHVPHLSGARMPVGRPWYWAVVLNARRSIVSPTKSVPDTAMLACRPLLCVTQTVRGKPCLKWHTMTHQYSRELAAGHGEKIVPWCTLDCCTIYPLGCM